MWLTSKQREHIHCLSMIKHSKTWFKNDLWEPKQKNAMVSYRILGLHQSVVFRVAERVWP